MSIKTGLCNNILYNAAMDILNEITGEKWGFVQTKIKILYVTCGNIPIKFAAKSSRGSKKIDYYIRTKSTTPEWENALRFELYKALYEYLQKNSCDANELYMEKMRKFIHKGVSVEDCTLDLSKCKEICRYKETFVPSKNDWIRDEISDVTAPKILVREDFL